MNPPKDPKTFRRGLTVLQRQKFRQLVLERELETARRKAATMYVSITCRNALAATGAEDPEYVRALHQQCKGELPGNIGCLCPCHDIIQGSIETGSVEVPDIAI